MNKSQPPPPTLADKYSGVPSRLTLIAQTAKDQLYSHKTVPESSLRRHNVRLPPDTTQAAFDAALAALKKNLGKENVVLNDKPLVDGWYLEHPNTHDAFHLVDQEDLVSSAVAYPASTVEVQTIVKWANEYAIPIYPISMGRNVGYGGSAPRVPGSVVVDLGRRMNKILNIDAENASCVVEPGSVFGNAIDRGVGYTPMGDHFANHCGMEVVLPNGELLRTGMGALPGKNEVDNPTWQSFQPAYGPYSDGIFSQSNFGIVCQMGFFLMRETGHQSYMITFPRDEDFPEIVETIRPLAQKGILGNIPQLRHVAQELNVTGLPKSHWYAGSSPLPRQLIRQHASKLPCGDCSWIFYGTQYGNTASIETQLTIIKSAFSRIQGSKFFLPSDLPADHYIHSRALVCSGVPILRELDWLNWKPNAAHLFFSPITPTHASDAQVVHDINVHLHAKYGFDLFPTLCVSGREMHYITNIIYDRSSNDEKRRAAALMRELIVATASEGYGEYRTHLLFADQVARTYSWGNNALMRFNETIKDALDPNGILAPGRNGIWPKKYRGKGWELLGESVEKAVGGGTISPKL
ncbi:vanillyl alcohol oxidase [Pleomassaria siparia CBS 279.74]|uniref:Vanillyl alcohol oxidase n=1 Tax=Pleomassaria siparia CBS 279.74 TaxID=1314801 RepID=A0A6G1KBI3_9PLEO|nr:vanillyl alcohol oxidase [Pleomassaria siparia CBS 279.74]